MLALETILSASSMRSIYLSRYFYTYKRRLVVAGKTSFCVPACMLLSKCSCLLSKGGKKISLMKRGLESSLELLPPYIGTGVAQRV